MKRLLTVMVAAIVIVATALADMPEKMSAGTQILLSQRSENGGRTKVRQKLTYEQATDALPFVDEQVVKRAIGKVMIADVEQYNGVEMISAFVRVSNGAFGPVEALGGVMQSNFGNGLAAMLLPVDKIGQISDLFNVTYIEVAEVLETVNDRQRSVTQAIDAMTNSDAAKALGLSSKYTGKGVILGVIDSGIDFQHIAFKDAAGNSRIVRAYTLSGSNSTALTTYSTASAISGLTYDTNDGDHGTHTSSTAGGSSVIVNGTTVTVTDDHENATYGGMAPEADLVIAGLSSLYTTSIGTAIQNICNYADQVGKPCVISLSLGSQVGPHDGTGTIASIVDQYAGDNHIIVYAASNDGMRAQSFVDAGMSSGGGMYASGTSTSSKPMLVNVQRCFSNADGNVEMLYPTITAYARTANVPTSLKFHVVNVSTGAVVYSSSAYTSSTTITVTGTTGLATYFRSSTSYYNQYGDAGKIRITRTQDSNGKYYWQVYCPIMISTSYSDSNSDGVYEGAYAFCVSVYPTSTTASTTIDMWENSYCWFGNDLNLNSTYSGSYNYCAGNDECSVSDNACYDKVISVGAYVTRNSVTNYAGTVTDASGEYPNIGDHAYFSSWQTAGYGPLGTALPHINAPGARIIAAVNHYHTSSVDDYSYYGDDYSGDLIVNSSSNPYAAMEGTSMATPCVSGIIAQWLQACVEKGVTPSPDYIKEVMENTWDTDQWTNGAGHGAKTFGTHGKINAIKGIQYILGVTGGPILTASETDRVFSDTFVGETATKYITVTGSNLEAGVTLSLNDPAGVFALSANSISMDDAEAGEDIAVTFTPLAATAYSATLTISSDGADDVVVALSGSGKAVVPTLEANKVFMHFTRIVAGTVDHKRFAVSGHYLTGDVTLTTSGENFSVEPTTISAADAMAGDVEILVTYYPAATGSHNDNIVITSPGAQSVTIPLSGQASYYPPTMQPVDEYSINNTHFTAVWTDPTPRDDVASYTLYVATHEDMPRTGLLYSGNYSAYSKVGSGNSYTDIASSLSNYTDMTGWTGTSRVCSYSGYLQLGYYGSSSSRRYTGAITSPSYDLSGYNNDGKITVVVTTRVSPSRNTGSTTLRITTTAASGSSQNTDLSITNSKTTYTQVISGLGDATTVKFASTSTSYPIALYDIHIYAGETDANGNATGTSSAAPRRRVIAESGDATARTITGIPGTQREYTVEGLTENGTFDYWVTANYVDGSTARTSNVEVVTLADPITSNPTPVMLAAADEFIDETSFRAEWTDNTASSLVKSYTLWVNKKLEKLAASLLEAVDMSEWEPVVDEDDHITSIDVPTYFGDGWTGSGVFAYYGSALVNGNIKTPTYSGLSAYGNKITLHARAASYYPSNYGQAKFTLTTSAGSKTITLSTDTYDNADDYPEYAWVLDCADEDYVNITVNTNIAEFVEFQIYAGDLTANGLRAPRRRAAVEEGDATTRTITGIEQKSFDLTELESCGTFDYKVRAVYTDGTLSAWSNTRTVTLLEPAKTLAEIVAEDNIEHKYRVSADDLTAVFLSDDGRTLYCKDDNGYAVTQLRGAGDDVDYVLEKTDLMDDKGAYDESNWVALTIANGVEGEFPVSLLNHKISGVRGVVTDLTNPTIVLDEGVMPTADDGDIYLMNTFIIPSFGDREQTSASGVTYSFVNPKPMEVATVTWALWDATANCFVTPPSVGSVNQAGLTGEIAVDFSEYIGQVPTLNDGGIYSFTAITKYNAGNTHASKRRAAGGGLTVFPLDGLTEIGSIDGSVVTDVRDINVDGDVKSVLYSNPAGQVSNKPFDGVNIVIITKKDGTCQILKRLF
ncbi:MAG: S8 family serine peptidase [Muribaculaceae bacterium]|nr:S8 family serine peptidase [Muribaculaceae bacterium]